MFFKDVFVFIFFKYLWVGIILGFIKIFLDIIDRFTRNNVYIYNIIYFIFWLAFSLCFIYLCNIYYDSSFCLLGLIGMFLGLILVKYSLNFLLTSLFIMVYHKVNRLKVKGILDEKK